LHQLKAAPWAEVLAIQALIVVLDGQVLGNGGPISQAVLAAMDEPCTIVINKAEGITPDNRLRIEAKLQQPLLWITQGRLGWDTLSPGQAAAGHRNTTYKFALPQRQVAGTASGSLATGWSKGWQAPAEQLIDASKVEALLERWPWTRAKMILHTRGGWQSANLLPHQPLTWRASEWRKDSRLELIFDEPQDAGQLDDDWAACLVT
jgi:hypothetical protein